MYDMVKQTKERTKLICVRLTPVEFRRLMADAEHMYLPLSSYVRHKLFADESGGAGKRRSGQRGRRK